MYLTFVSQHKSIKKFDDLTLPQLTIITGVNGSGKSHLLESLINGNIQVTQPTFSPHTGEIRRFDWNDIKLQDSASISPNEIGQERHQWWEQIYPLIENTKNRLEYAINRVSENSSVFSENWVSNISQTLAFDYLSGKNEFRDIPLSSKIEFILSLSESTLELHVIKAIIDIEESNLIQAIESTTELGPIILKIKSDTNKSIFLLNESSFLEYCPLSTAPIDFLQNNFATLFAQYRKLQLENERREFLSKCRDTGQTYLNQEEFVEKYGIPPWELLNNIFESAALDFKIEAPPQESLDKMFGPRLIHNINSETIQFSDISSGEKVLMSFAQFLYYSDQKNQIIQYPKLLLLDEIDATLHPSMTGKLLNIVQEVLIKQRNLHVIMTTHSPATLALAPEDSIFIANNRSSHFLRKAVDKDEALSALLVGVPSLRIDYKNNRQVFTESSYDVKTYTTIYNKIKRELKQEIPLYFISSGSGKNTGDCEQVKKWCKELRLLNNLTICGIIDWDLKNTSGESVKVLGQGKRYSRENYIFDPLLLIPFLLLEGYLNPEDINLPQEANFINFLSYKDSFQDIVDNFFNLILNKWIDATNVKLETRDRINVFSNLETVECHYSNLSVLQIPRWYLHINGHYLLKIDESWDGILPTAFTRLKSHRTAENLEESILSKVFEQMPQLLSLDFIDLFNDLQNI